MLSSPEWGCSRRSAAAWRRHGSACSRARAAPRRSTRFEVSDVSSKIACVIPRGDGSDGTFNPDQWMEPKEQRKVDSFIVYAHVRGAPGARRCRLASAILRRSDPIRCDDRLRHRRRRRHCRKCHHPARKGAAPDFAVLHPRPHHQSRLRLCVDRVRPQGSQSRRGHRLFDRRPCHRRCRAHGGARRCRRDGGGRHRISRSIALRSPASRRCARCRPGSTTIPNAPRAPTTGTATAS